MDIRNDTLVWIFEPPWKSNSTFGSTKDSFCSGHYIVSWVTKWSNMLAKATMCRGKFLSKFTVTRVTRVTYSILLTNLIIWNVTSCVTRTYVTRWKYYTNSLVTNVMYTNWSLIYLGLNGHPSWYKQPQMHNYKVPISKIFHEFKLFIHKQNKVYKLCSTFV